MKININKLLILFCLNICSCQSQIKNKFHAEVLIIKDSIKCNKEIFFYEFPDILGKNENNFFNTVIAKDYMNYLDSEKPILKPIEFVRESIRIKKKNCDNNNFSGLLNTNCTISFNNFNLLSVIMNYESLAGSSTIETYYYNFDVKNSRMLQYKDVLKEEKVNALIKISDKILNGRLKDLFNEEKKNLKDSDIYKSLIKSKNIFKKDNLTSFIIREDGIEFIYNYGFNKGDFDIEDNLFFSFKQIEMFLKDDFKKNIGWIK
ncbi:hypothetical protein GON26_12195 [Flavobacterium sp. GA093]|uniref:DUF3298 domain-containing protein n=1 Tax=Flavobacterium hydrocarbonoxydans TaxID=2683249 RepID=A0A6I4NVT2_9FLAO|nr:hypothetical protein [Flavobacterium hydrocarbonoxydans]MWB95124.1 hypothetical protein [Flavobacterium hydrocarbonoxydans]